MEFYCKAGNCKCQGTEVSDIKEDSMVREHVKRILISLLGWCSLTPWSHNSKGWWESGWVGEDVIWGHQEAELTETDSLWPKHGIAFPFPWNWAGSVCGCKQSLSSSFHKAQEPEPWKLRGRWENAELFRTRGEKTGGEEWLKVSLGPQKLMHQQKTLIVT